MGEARKNRQGSFLRYGKITEKNHYFLWEKEKIE